MPKLTKWRDSSGNGFYINPTPPEESAVLREAGWGSGAFSNPQMSLKSRIDSYAMSLKRQFDSNAA